MYSQHCTSRNSVPTHTIRASCMHATTAVLIACAWIADTDATPVHSSRSVFRSVSVFWYTTLYVSILSTAKDTDRDMRPAVACHLLGHA
jgi:hypothetical protein